MCGRHSACTSWSCVWAGAHDRLRLYSQPAEARVQAPSVCRPLSPCINSTSLEDAAQRTPSAPRRSFFPAHLVSQRESICVWQAFRMYILVLCGPVPMIDYACVPSLQKFGFTSHQCVLYCLHVCSLHVSSEPAANIQHKVCSVRQESFFRSTCTPFCSPGEQSILVRLMATYHSTREVMFASSTFRQRRQTDAPTVHLQLRILPARHEGCSRQQKGTLGET